MKNLKYLLCSLALIPALYSCDKNDDNSVKFDKSSVSVVVGKTSKVTINGTEASYTAVSSDTTIAKATIAAKEVTLSGIKEGKAVVTVKAKSGNTGKVAVTVTKN